MTLHVYDFEQRSDEWYAARCGIVTASVVGKLITPSTLKPARNPESRSLTALLVAERITGYTEPTYTSDDMFRGIEHEPIARDYYAKHFASVTETGFMVLEQDGRRLGYSPDGLVGDDVLLEIKCPRAKSHVQTILSGDVPAHHMAQCQAGLLVSGRDRLDFVSFCAGQPLFVRCVYPDPKWFDAITEAVDLFEATAAAMVARYHAMTEGLPITERIAELEMSL